MEAVMNKTELITCKHCEVAFQVGLIEIPSRKGCYCPECGEYNPYAWRVIADKSRAYHYKQDES
jgi:uncharacterized paraquat-inducible protein A